MEKSFIEPKCSLLARALNLPRIKQTYGSLKLIPQL